MTTVAVTMTVGVTTRYWMAPVADQSTTGSGVTAPDIVQGYIYPADGATSQMSVQLDPGYDWDVRVSFRNAPPVYFDGFAPGSGGDLLELLTAQGWVPDGPVNDGPNSSVVTSVNGVSGAVVLSIPAIDQTATDIKGLGIQSAGSVGSAADAGHVHGAPGWLPGDNNLMAACDSLAAISSTFIVVKGVQYMMKVPVRAPITVSSVSFIVSTSGAGASTGSFVGLMSPSGQLLTGSADCAAQFTGANAQTVSLTTPQSLTPGTTPFFWVLILSNLATTQPTFRTAGTATSALPNLGLTAANFRAASQGSGSITALQSVTPSANSATPLIWVGTN